MFDGVWRYASHEFNSLWPSDAIWCHITKSALVQVMACCLTAPGHYLNQCWLITSKVHWHSSADNFTRYTSDINHQNWLENYWSKISIKSPRGQWVNELTEFHEMAPLVIFGAVWMLWLQLLVYCLSTVHQMLRGSRFLCGIDLIVIMKFFNM